MVENLLKGYKDVNAEICRLNADLNDILKAKLNADGCLQCTRITGLPRGTDTNASDKALDAYINLNDNLEQIYCELGNYAEYIKWRINTIINDKIKIDQSIALLDPDEYRIITLRYIAYPEPKYDWKKVIAESFYSKSQCFEIHKRAIKKIEQNIGLNRTKDAV